MNHVEETSTVSRKQLEANRRNANNSTGPKTDEGTSSVKPWCEVYPVNWTTTWVK
jgi:hypothetical protein